MGSLEARPKTLCKFNSRPLASPCGQGFRLQTTNGCHWISADCQTVKNACKFDLDQSEHRSSQVSASAFKTWPNEVFILSLAICVKIYQSEGIPDLGIPERTFVCLLTCVFSLPLAALFIFFASSFRAAPHWANWRRGRGHYSADYNAKSYKDSALRFYKSRK